MDAPTFADLATTINALVSCNEPRQHKFSSLRCQNKELEEMMRLSL